MGIMNVVFVCHCCGCLCL